MTAEELIKATNEVAQLQEWGFISAEEADNLRLVLVNEWRTFAGLPTLANTESFQ